MIWKERWELIKNTCIEFVRESSLMHGAALSYYSILALIPMMYLAITYVGRLVGNEVVVQIISGVMKDWVGVKDSSGIFKILNEINFQNSSLFLQIAGVIALLFSCSAIFNSLRVSLNTFYDIDDFPLERKRVIIHNLIGRLVSMAFVLGVTVLIIVLYFGATMFLSFGTQLLSDSEMLSTAFIGFIDNAVPVLTNLILFTFIFKFMHDGKVSTRYAFRGALVTTGLLFIGQLLIHYYLSHYFFAANGGVAGTMLVTLVWVYYMSQIIFFGAKYIAVFARMKGNPIEHRSIKK